MRSQTDSLRRLINTCDGARRSEKLRLVRIMDLQAEPLTVAEVRVDDVTPVMS